MLQSTILIVDDKKANVYSLKELLHSENITILEAFSGEECLKHLLESDIDLILLDIQMPNMDGFETAQYIQQNNRTKSIPIIFVTAAAKTDSINLKGYKYGAIDIIYKPINETILRSKVNHFLEIAQTRKELKEQVEMLQLLNEENHRMQEKIKQLALHDYLTGLFNRRHLDDVYNRYYRDAYRNKRHLSVLMVDLDDFKNYNDYFGHGKGDEALKKISTAIEHCLKRSLDIVGRYGGEEFLILLPDTDCDGAQSIAKSILQEVENQRISTCPKCILDYLTVSIGISTQIPTNILEVNSLIEESDKALYIAKKNGKNQYSIYQKENHT